MSHIKPGTKLIVLRDSPYSSPLKEGEAVTFLRHFGDMDGDGVVVLDSWGREWFIDNCDVKYASTKGARPCHTSRRKRAQK